MPSRMLELSLYALAASLSIVFGVWTERLQYSLELQDKTTMALEASYSVVARIEGEISSLVALTKGMAAVIAYDPDLSHRDYARTAARLSKDLPMVRNIARARDYVVQDVYPRQPNAAVLGIDYRDMPEHLPNVELARSSEAPVFLGPLDLVQGGRGFIIRLATPERDHDWSGSWSLISLVADADAFFAAAGLAETAGDLAFAIRRSDGAAVLGDQALFDADPVLTKIATTSGAWEMAVVPKIGWPTHSSGRNLVIALGLARTLIVFAVLTAAFRLLRQRKRAEARFLAAIEALDDGFALYDDEDRLQICNQRIREIYPAMADLIVPGTRFETVLRAGVARGQYDLGGQDAEDWIRERMAIHSAADSVIEQKLSDGRWLKIAERRSADGGTVGFRVDITELKLAIEAAQASSRAKSDFISVLSHELRTPMTVIIGNAKLIASSIQMPRVQAFREALPAEAETGSRAEFDQIRETLERMARKVDESAQFLMLLINDILDFSKIEAGKMQLKYQPVGIAEILDDAGDSFRTAAADKGLCLQIEAIEGLVWADPMRLKQVLLNLIGNAVKFTEAGRIRVTAESLDGAARFQVTDTGCGIPANMQGTIFELFEQVDASVTRRAGGTGLGLAISKQLVELMGGRIGVESVLGEGSSFWFTVPLDKAGQGRRQPGQVAAKDPAVAGWSRG